jgi:hypothetical protein
MELHVAFGGNSPLQAAFVTQEDGPMDDIWSLERDFWLNGPEFYERHLDAQCVMAFSSPAGIMRRDAILASLRSARRWQSVDMSNRTQASPATGLAIVAYEVEARRDGGSPYRAICLSNYRSDGGAWLMTSHQQTPVETA